MHESSYARIMFRETRGTYPYIGSNDDNTTYRVSHLFAKLDKNNSIFNQNTTCASFY